MPTRYRVRRTVTEGGLAIEKRLVAVVELPDDAPPPEGAEKVPANTNLHDERPDTGTEEE